MTTFALNRHHITHVPDTIHHQNIGRDDDAFWVTNGESDRERIIKDIDFPDHREKYGI